MVRDPYQGYPPHFHVHTGPSAGKFGPFIGRTEQWFPTETPGKLNNAVTLFGGLLRFVLIARYERSGNHKIIVHLEKVHAYFAGVLVRFFLCLQRALPVTCCTLQALVPGLVEMSSNAVRYDSASYVVAEFI
jgi:hypothetical protein